jgi:hypothetical protein
MVSSFRGMCYHRWDHFYHRSVNIALISTLLNHSELSYALGNPPERYWQTQQFRCRSSFKVRRRRRRRVNEKLAALALEDLPDVMEDVVYITTVEEADEWAKTAVVEHILKYIHTSRTILAGVYAIWQHPPNTENDHDAASAFQDAIPDTTSISHHDLQRSLLSREDDIFELDVCAGTDVWVEEEELQQKQDPLPSQASDVLAQEDDADNVDGLEQEEKFTVLSQDADVALQENNIHTMNMSQQEQQLSLLQISIPKAPVAVFDFAAMRKNARTAKDGDQEDAPPMQFPKYLKYLLQLPSLIVCAVQANALVDQLLLHCNVDCLTRADLVDMARCALSYQEGFQSTASFDLDQIALSPIPVVLDELFYQFFGPVNRDEVLRFERPPVDASPNLEETAQPLSEEHVRYYAAHAYHARLLAATMIETVDLSEATVYHEDDEAFVYLCDPNIPFHHTMDRLPQMLCHGHKVALLTEIDDEYDDERRRLTRSRKHRIMASGKVEFVGEPYGITRRFPGTSYLVGQHEEEAIVRLKRVSNRFSGRVPLCRGYKYWQHPSQDGDKALDWPDSPTLEWVLKNAKPPWIVVEKSRLELMEYIEDLPTDKPWVQRKKTDNLPGLPLDISKFI